MNDRYIDLLKRLIATPSISRDEKAAADVLEEFMSDSGANPHRVGNNIYCMGKGCGDCRHVLMLNSHIDTVRPSASYTFDPYSPIVRDGRLYGLGSNDAGASLVSLVAAFLALKDATLPFGLLLGISCEEEVTGAGGMRMLLPALAEKGIAPDMAIVGEPTGMRPAVAERGLLVLDCVTRGVAGHAARNEGVNAIYRAMADIDAMRDFSFPRESQILGPVKVNVTQIQSGTQHNVVPDECRWVTDVRTTDAYTNAETVSLLAGAVSDATTVTPRSTHLHASVIDTGHPLVRAAVAAGYGEPFVSPTLSDRSVMHGIKALKIGPGESARSHSADEYIYLSEIEQGIEGYQAILAALAKIQ